MKFEKYQTNLKSFFIEDLSLRKDFDEIMMLIILRDLVNHDLNFSFNSKIYANISVESLKKIAENIKLKFEQNSFFKKKRILIIGEKELVYLPLLNDNLVRKVPTDIFVQLMPLSEMLLFYLKFVQQNQKKGKKYLSQINKYINLWSN